MKVLQLIDSLRPGGAEKMAVSYANILVANVESSYLCCTREDGLLRKSLDPRVKFLFLRKSSTIDLTAFKNLRNFIKEEEIDIIHAHSSSFFLAGLIKMSGVKCSLIWHIHNGASEDQMWIYSIIQSSFSRLFNGIITVNSSLKEWALKELHCKNVIELKNFVPFKTFHEGDKDLKGDPKSFKIICVANFRNQKDHLNLLKAFELLDHNNSFTLHLLGEDPGNEYSKSIFRYIDSSPVNHLIYYYGVRLGIIDLLKNADLGVLASTYEGLPVALLEYGIAGLPVVTTDLDQYKEVIGDNGLVVPSGQPLALSNAIRYYYQNKDKMGKDAERFHENILMNFSEDSVISQIQNFYMKCHANY